MALINFSHLLKKFVLTHFSNLDAAITMICRTELQNTKELCATASGNCSSKIGSRRQSENEVPLIAACSHFPRKNTRFHGLASPRTNHIEHSCSHYNAFCIWTMHTSTTTLPNTTLSSPFLPFVTTSLRHHWPSSPTPFIHVLLCDAKSHAILHECTPTSCKVSRHPSWMYCCVSRI